MLTSWLHQIVLIVLFAVVMDLIIPSSAMQKYIKLVMGFVIMVTLLKPVGIMFDKQFDVSRIQWPEQMAQFASFDSIKQQAAVMQREQVNHAEQQWSDQLEKLVKQQVESQYPLQVSQVLVQFKNQKNQTADAPEIEKLSLVVQADSGQNAKNAGIQPVQPIEIQPGERNLSNSRPTDTKKDDSVLMQVKQDLANKLQIASSMISIEWKSI